MARSRRDRRARDSRRDAPQRPTPDRLEARGHEQPAACSARSPAAASKPTSPSARRRSSPVRPVGGRHLRHRRRRGLERRPAVRRRDRRLRRAVHRRAADRARHELRRRRRRGRSASDGTTTHLARTGLREEDARTVFAEAVAPPPRLVAVGAGDIAEALCALARPLGWRTSSSTRAPGLRHASACRAPTRSSSRGPTRSRSTPTPPSSRSCTRSGSTSPRCARASRAARSTSAPSAHDAHRRNVASTSATSPTRCTGRSGSISAAKAPAEIALEILAEIFAARKRG